MLEALELDFAPSTRDGITGRCGRAHTVLPIIGRLGVLLAGLAWWAARRTRSDQGAPRVKILPETDVNYWLAMLTAGVFGTVLGDLLQQIMGQGVAALALALVLAGALARSPSAMPP